MNIENITGKDLLLEIIKRIRNKELDYNFSFYLDSDEIAVKISDPISYKRIELLVNYNAEELYLKIQEYKREEKEQKRIKSNNEALTFLISSILKRKVKN